MDKILRIISIIINFVFMYLLIYWGNSPKTKAFWILSLLPLILVALNCIPMICKITELEEDNKIYKETLNKIKNKLKGE